MLKNLPILLLLLFAKTLSAQITISGKVLNINKKPVPDATVFLSNTKTGNKSGDDGTFDLHNVKYGKYDLVVRCIGYETYHQDVIVKGTDINLYPILLLPKATELKEVRVRANNRKPMSKSERDSYIRLFLKEFFGQTPNASDCKLLNPDLLDVYFDKNTDKLVVGCTDFLIIENKSLGYRIKYLLESFLKDPRNGLMHYVGSSIFEEMKGTPDQEKRWQKKRGAAYLGSQMHFLRACIADVTTSNYFTVYKLLRVPNPERPADSLINVKLKQFGSFSANFRSDSLRYWIEKSKMPKYDQKASEMPLKERDYIKLTPEKGIYAIGYEQTDCLLVNYKFNYNYSNYHSTMITFKEPYSYFDNNGIVINPLSNIMEGYWATLRIADLLPVDYELPGNTF